MRQNNFYEGVFKTLHQMSETMERMEDLLKLLLIFAADEDGSELDDVQKIKMQRRKMIKIKKDYDKKVKEEAEKLEKEKKVKENKVD